MSADISGKSRLCSMSDLVAGSGVAALINEHQIALFYMPALDPPVYAIGNHDPFSGANVLARGLLGDVRGCVVVASPIYKQHFDLATGVCLEDSTVSVPCFDVVLAGDDVWISI